MRIPEWFKKLRKLLGWPMLIAGGLITITGNILDIREIGSIGLPVSVWQLIGFVLIFGAIVSILYQFQNQLESVPQTSPLPKQPKYNKEQKKVARDFLDDSIKRGEELKSCILPSSERLGDIRTETTNLTNLAESKIWELIPEYSEYFSSIPDGLDIHQYSQWRNESREESKKLDRLLFKLRKIRSQL